MAVSATHALQDVAISLGQRHNSASAGIPLILAFGGQGADCHLLAYRVWNPIPTRLHAKSSEEPTRHTLPFGSENEEWIGKRRARWLIEVHNTGDAPHRIAWNEKGRMDCHILGSELIVRNA